MKKQLNLYLTLINGNFILRKYKLLYDNVTAIQNDKCCVKVEKKTYKTSTTSNMTLGRDFCLSS